MSYCYSGVVRGGLSDDEGPYIAVALHLAIQHAIDIGRDIICSFTAIRRSNIRRIETGLTNY